MRRNKIISLLLFLLAISVVKGQKFFTSTNYRGAFSSTDWSTGWANWNPRNTSYPATTVTVTGEITSNTTWTASKTYLLTGYVYVKNGATLTIEPGTVIRGDLTTTGTLVITRGAKIVAAGTKDLPIIFTSSESAGSRSYGDWGGILLLGNAKINVIGGSADVGAGINNTNNDGLFGGTNDNDSSGILKYVRIEFAGIQYQPDKEINGLTLAGVGAKTKIEYVMLSYCGNDAFRFAGGNVQAKYLISNKTFDSDFALDLGYTGQVQFAVIQRDSTKANSAGSSSFDVQNDALGTNASPNTFPVFSNITVLGPMTNPATVPSSNYRYGIHLRRNAKIGFFNSAIAGYPRNIMLDGTLVGNNLAAKKIVIQNNMISGYRTKHIDSTNKFTVGAPGISPLTWLSDAANFNTLTANPKDLKYVKPYDYTTPVFVLASGSPLSSDASFAHELLGGVLSAGNITEQNLQFWGIYSETGLTIKSHTNFSEIVKAEVFDITGKSEEAYTLKNGEHTSSSIVMKNCILKGGIKMVVLTDRKGNRICFKTCN